MILIVRNIYHFDGYLREWRYIEAIYETISMVFGEGRDYELGLCLGEEGSR